MNKSVMYVGIDVDDQKFQVALIDVKTGELHGFKTRANVSHLVKKLSEFKDQGFDLKICYEATYIGFSLYRALRKEGFNAEIIAPSLIPTLASHRVKTDRLDAEKLARFFMSNLLTIVHVPTEQEESVRDVLRSRSFLADEFKRIKRHVISACRRQGWDYRTEEDKISFWTLTHMAWMKRKISACLDHPTKINFQILLASLTHVETQLALYDQHIAQISQNDTYKNSVHALTAYRGIDTLQAMKIISEIGDPNRFPSPRNLTSFAGMDISEYSSGGKEKKFGISKMGNRHLRTAVIEACQQIHKPVQISRSLKIRRQNLEPQLTEVADRCMARLHKRYLHLSFRNKPINKIKVACARELLGFLWESLKKANPITNNVNFAQPTSFA